MIRLLCLLSLRLGCSLHAASRPNIIFILADDYGWGDPACYGHPYAKTPNIDRLAREGTRFTQFYATGVTCCPARTDLMTGKRPATFAKYPASFGFGDRVTVTELMKKAGYATGHFGKWHIGPSETPGTYGIDVIGSDEENTAPKPVDGGKDTRVYDNAIAFLEKHKDVPFYMNVWGHITHHPVDPTQKFVDEFASLKVNSEKADPAMRWQNWKLHGTHRARGEIELYDLTSDPGERYNLAPQKPDLMLELTTRLKAWADTLPKTYEHGDVKDN